jgi:hypothetical protein
MDNETKKIQLCFIPPSTEERKEIEEKAFEIFTRTVSANILCLSQTSTTYGYIAEEAFEAARVFVSESKFQSDKYEKYAEYEKEQKTA